MTPVDVVQGSGPVVLGLPHTGTFVPPDIAQDLNATGFALADTDWHIDQLYRDLLPDVTMVRATFHRYVIDANRDPDGVSLYPGQNTTGLVPMTDFDGVDLWNTPPGDTEVTRRKQLFHAPYHAALTTELARIRALHGVAILYDCHSIRSRIPFLFSGVLPDFNIGTNVGDTCDARLEQAVADLCQGADGYTSISNGRFKGGWTTRHYGRPGDGVHAIQMELAQSTYLAQECAPWAYDRAKADRLRPILCKILTVLADLAPSLKGAT